MLTLNDGRNELWQWDTGRKLTVDAECSQVHFSNKVFGRSIDVDVVEGVATIPDILLQTDKELTAWAFVGTADNGYTKISKVFKVNRRNKPADYVFTPPEQTTLGELVERLDKIEESQDPDAIKNAVEDYLEQNPVEAPVQSVNGKTGKVKLTAEDVGAISQDDLQEATNEALAKAKESGEFDGEPGAPGQDYVLTDADKEEIAKMAAGLVEIPDSGGNVAYDEAQTLTDEQKAQARENIGLGGLTLGRHTDGLLYLFADDVPMGNGVELPSGGIDGYVDSDKNIVVRGLSEGAYTFYFEMEDGSLVKGAEMVLDTNTYYSVTNTLTNCVSDNSATQAVGGESYSATISADSGYELTSLVVTMGGEDISATAVSGGAITVAEVTGDIVITAVAEATEAVTATNFFVIGEDGYIINGRCSSTGADRTDASGSVVSNYINVENGDTLSVNQDCSHHMYSGLKYADGTTTGFVLNSSDLVSGYSYADGVTQFTINSENASAVRICCMIGTAGVDLTEADVTSANIVINIQRNGEWL